MKRDGSQVIYYGVSASVGEVLATITPQRIPCTIDLCEEMVHDGVAGIDRMVSCVTHHSFINVCVIQGVHNVEMGELEVEYKNYHSFLYMTIKEKSEVTRNIVGPTIQVQSTSSFFCIQHKILIIISFIFVSIFIFNI